MSSIFLKINLYILSLSILFVCYFVISVKFPINCDFDWFDILLNNLISIICLILILYSIFCYKYFNFMKNGSQNIPFTIKQIENKNYEYDIFITTYIVPFTGLNINNWQQIFIVIFLLVIIGVISIKANLFYSNPVLAIFGFYIYKVDGDFKNNKEKKDIIIISKQKLKLDDKVSYVELSDEIYFVRKNKNDEK